MLMERSRLVLLDAGVLHTVAQGVPSLALPTAMALPLVHPAHRASEKGQRLEETQAFLESPGPETTQHFLSFVYHSSAWPCPTPKEPVKGVIVGKKSMNFYKQLALSATDNISSDLNSVPGPAVDWKEAREGTQTTK